MTDEMLTYLYDKWSETPEGRTHVMDGSRLSHAHKVAAFRKWLSYFQPGTASVLYGFITEYRRQERDVPV